jgi:hypothetical protein
MGLIDRLASVRQAGYAANEMERLLLLVHRNPTVDGAADVINELVERLSPASVDRLVGLILAPFAEPGSFLNEYTYSEEGGDFVIARLGELRIGVSDTMQGWRLELTNGTSLLTQYRDLHELDHAGTLPSRDAALARLALKAVLLSRTTGAL